MIAIKTICTAVDFAGYIVGAGKTGHLTRALLTKAQRNLSGAPASKAGAGAALASQGLRGANPDRQAA